MKRCRLAVALAALALGLAVPLRAAESPHRKLKEISLGGEGGWDAKTGDVSDSKTIRGFIVPTDSKGYSARDQKGPRGHTRLSAAGYATGPRHGRGRRSRPPPAA